MLFRKKQDNKPAYYYFCHAKAESKHPLEWGIFIFAIGTTVATAFAACATWGQWGTAEHQERMSLRAYVVVTGFGVYCPDCGDNATVPKDIIVTRNATNIIIENNGQTPAYNVRHTMSFYSQPGVNYHIPVEFDFHDAPLAPDFNAAIFDIGRDKSRPVLGPLNAIGMDQIRQAIEKKITLFLYGHIDYCDTFREPHTTEFCTVYIPNGGSAQAMCDRHNGEVPGKHKC